MIEEPKQLLVGSAEGGGKLEPRTTLRNAGESLADWYARNGSSESESQILITFVDCNGKTELVSTLRLEGESVEDWNARHQARVDAKKKECEGQA